MDAEYARVTVDERDRLSKREFITFLIDGWEDSARRSLYGCVAAGVGEYPQVLGLEDLTGHRGSADKLVQVATKVLEPPGVNLVRNVVAATTDDPTVMQSFRRKLQGKYYWILVFWCFLHKLNTILGHIVAYPEMKAIITATTRIVSFFNSSHFWGGQLSAAAKEEGINRKLQTNTESRWYSLILMALTVLSQRKPLTAICMREDAQRKVGGFSPVSPAVITTVLYTREYWVQLNQLVKTCKPIVDAIGNLELRKATLADCMLELLRCAREMYRIPLEEEDSVGFWTHAKRVFNTEFHKIDTDVHDLALFLHPLCRKLALSNAAKSRTFESICKTALKIANQLRMKEEDASALIEDLKQYRQCKGPFVGAGGDAKEWWEDIDGEKHPLQRIAILLHSVVPHAAEVERLFSNLGGIQGRRRSNLTVENFKKLGVLRNHYSYLLWERDRKAGIIWKNLSL
ncbi:hypothetical protein K474DRAFT_1603514 [Panus rudis PR-1116 ss-1]|nr:hypothetical protein K474DRAFT_1603514 [Panus rudis PR-1116 ss-1]